MIVIREIELPYDSVKQAYTLPEEKYAADPAVSPKESRKPKVWDKKEVSGVINELLAQNKLLVSKEYKFGKVISYKYPAPGDRYQFGAAIMSGGVMRYVKIFAAPINAVKELFKKVLFSQRTEHEALISEQEVVTLLTKAYGVNLGRNKDSAITRGLVQKFTEEFKKRFGAVSDEIVASFKIKSEYVKDYQKEADKLFSQIQEKSGALLSDEMIVTLLYIDTNLGLKDKLADSIKVIEPDVDALYVDICKMAFFSCVRFVQETVLDFQQELTFLYAIYAKAGELTQYATIGAMVTKGISFIKQETLQGFMRTQLLSIETLLQQVKTASTRMAAGTGLSAPGSSSSTGTGTSTSESTSTGTGEQGGDDSKTTTEDETIKLILQEKWSNSVFKQLESEVYTVCENSMKSGLESLKGADKELFLSISKDNYAADNSKEKETIQKPSRMNLFEAYDIQPSEFPLVAKYTKNGDLPLYNKIASTGASLNVKPIRLAVNPTPTGSSKKPTQANNQAQFRAYFFDEVIHSFDEDFNQVRGASMDALEGRYNFQPEFLDSPEAKKVITDILVKEKLITLKKDAEAPEVAIEENSYKVFEFFNSTDETILAKPFKAIADAVNQAKTTGAEEKRIKNQRLPQEPAGVG